MSIWRLIIREIIHRRGNFAVAVLSVLIAVAVLVAAFTLLRAHDARTGRIISDKIAETESTVRDRQAAADRMAADLREAYRKIMLKFGYNLLILPKTEKMIDYQLQGAGSKYMPESNVRTLADSRLMTVRHLLPVLQQKQIVIFGDKRQEVFLVGARGEVPLGHRAPKKPLMPAVPPGEMVVGYNVRRDLGVDVGGKVKVLDREFAVSKVYPARGTNDDSSVWIDLKQAQELLGCEGKISGILALNCVCGFEGLAKVKQDIVRVLPGTQVRVKMTDAVIRYEARRRAAREAADQLARARREGEADVLREEKARADLKGQIEAFAAWIVPLILVGSAVWLALLAYGNVRERRGEIGVLRALGVRSGRIFSLFLARALITGALGACLGYAAGFGLAVAWGRSPAPGEIFDPLLAGAVVPAAILLSCLASWAPATLAARQDPAVVLSQE